MASGTLHRALLLWCLAAALLVSSAAADAAAAAALPGLTAPARDNSELSVIASPTRATKYPGQTLTVSVGACPTCVGSAGACAVACQGPSFVAVQLSAASVGILSAESFCERVDRKVSCPEAQRATAGPGQTLNVPLASGLGTFEITSNVTGTSIITVNPTDINSTRASVTDGQTPDTVSTRDTSLDVVVDWVPPTPSQLLLLPRKAERRVHQPITLTAVALDASKQPVPGVSVAFSMQGDCLPPPVLSPVVAVTDSKGWASTTVTSTVPGSVAVVASALASGDASTTVTSSQAHLTFVGHHDDYPHSQAAGE